MMAEYGISRDEALALMQAQIGNDNLRGHCLAAEAVLRALARHLGEEEELWGLAGLLHDLDAETRLDLATHTHETAALLSGRGVDERIVEAIRLHNPTAWPGEARHSPLHHALAAGETITGLIIAAALVNPAKKLAAVKAKSVTKRFKEKAFARGADRGTIAECEVLGLSLAEFASISLTAMQAISDELGL